MGQAPSVEFLQALCKAFGVSGEWMLTGKGPMKSADMKQEALRQADAGDLLSALASSVETMLSRVDRLEQFMQLMEVRLRGLAASSPLATAPFQESTDGQAGRPRTEQAPPATLTPIASGRPRATPLHLADDKPEQAPVVAVPERVGKLRDALARRPHQDVD